LGSSTGVINFGSANYSAKCEPERPSPHIASCDINIAAGNWVTINMRIEGYIDDFGVMTFDALKKHIQDLLDAYAKLAGANK
jgi:hypothetical protein